VAAELRRGAPAESEDSYLASVSDLMVGMLFIFVIMLMAFALNYRTAEHEARVTLDELQEDKGAIAEEARLLAQERDRLAAERDDLARERDLLTGERDELRLERDSVAAQRDELGEITTHLLENDAERQQMLAAVQSLLRERQVDVVLDPANGILRLPESLLFDSGQAALRPEGVRALRELATVLARTLPCYSRAPDVQQLDCPLAPRPLLEAVLIEGHTDDVPIRTFQFADNWELAAGRALGTYRALIGYEASLELLKNGRGEQLLGVSAYEAKRPVSIEETVEARRHNRRIDLRFLIAAPSEEELGRIRGEIEALGR
jgi:chemotaxis protein MotB